MTPLVEPKPRRITPDDPHHLKLQTDAEAWLATNGFSVQSNTYHDRGLDAAFVARIQRMRNLTALVVRTQADRLALHLNHDFACYLEFKTISDERWSNLAVEALPLAAHRAKAKLGCRCLYVVRDVFPGRHYEGCFWADADIPWDTLFVPARWHHSELERQLAAVFPGLTHRRIGDTRGGSNDVFVRLQRSKFAAALATDWHAVVLRELERVRGRQ